MIVEMKGKRFGRLIVLDVDGKDGRAVTWKVKCDCGTIKVVRGGSLRYGRTRSCGCLLREVAGKRAKAGNWSRKHGLSNHPLYRVLVGMKARCYNKNTINYERYGARGITICNEWRNSFQVFIEWGLSNGWEKGLTIDRENNNKGYSPDNCRFITMKKNCRNRRSSDIIVYGEFKGTLTELAEKIGMDRSTLRGRIKILKWPIEKAVTAPLQEH